MSTENGLQASLLSMQESFKKIVKEKQLNQAPIYSRLLFMDNRGNILVDAGQSSGTPALWSNTELPETDQAATFALLMGNIFMQFSSAPFFIKKKEWEASSQR